MGRRRVGLAGTIWCALATTALLGGCGQEAPEDVELAPFDQGDAVPDDGGDVREPDAVAPDGPASISPAAPEQPVAPRDPGPAQPTTASEDPIVTNDSDAQPTAPPEDAEPYPMPTPYTGDGQPPGSTDRGSPGTQAPPNG